jgi:hypothetical protein
LLWEPASAYSFVSLGLIALLPHWMHRQSKPGDHKNHGTDVRK